MGTLLQGRDHRPLAPTGNSRGFFVSAASFRVERDRDREGASNLAQTKARLEAFKTLRNRIVHHLLEEHDLATQASCDSALALLA
ncbi:hypothetical protein ACIPRI_16040 [Variovorax sp. LARHSF232]